MIAATEQLELDFADRLRTQREDAALSQRELADAAGIHYTMISRYERGESTPTTDTLRAIAAALRITSDTLLDGTPSAQARQELGNQRLLSLFLQLQELETDDLNVVTTLIDAFLTRQKMHNLLVSCSC